MDFRILGPVEAHSGGHEVTLAGQRQRALLAYLLLHANETVSGHRLLDELWTTPPAGGLAALQTQMSRLRKLLDDRIATTRGGYVLRVEPGELDLDRFRSLLAEAGASADAEARSERLREADALWYGMPLEGLDAPFVAAEAAALEELRLSALEDRVEADLARGLGAELVSELSALVGRYPLRERLRGHLILALYRGGRQAEALEAYQDARRTLDEELGLEPSPALRELELAILRQDPAIDAPEPAPVLSSGEPDAESPPRRRRGVVIAVVPAAVAALGIGAAAAVATLLHSEPSHAAAPGTSVVYVERNIATTASGTHPAQTTTAGPASHTHSGGHTVTRATVRAAAPATTTRAASTVASAVVHHAATTTTHVKTTQRKTAHKPRIVTISDAFNGTQIDGTIWYQIYGGSGWTLSEHDGHLAFAFPSGSTPGGQWNTYGGHVGTVCEFPGNFDARVDFTLPQWPAASGLIVSLWVFFKPNNLGWEAVRQSSTQWGEQYGGWIGVGHGGSVSLDDTSGSLRVTRHNGTVTAYFLHNGNWLSLGSNTNSALAVIAVGAGSGESPPVSTDPAEVDFTNFTITGEDPICPAGAQGST